MKKFFFVFLITFCLVGKAWCFPTLTGRIVDEAQILSAQVEQQLKTLLQSEAQHQVVVVTLSDLEGKSIEEYGYQLGRHWGIGEKGNDNGVLLIIAPNERQARIEVGYGLEGVLTDALSSVILNDMSSALSENDYNQAVLIGTQQILNVIREEEFNTHPLDEIPTPLAIILACLILVLFIYVAMAPQNDRARRLRLILTIISFIPGRGGGFRGKGGSFGGGGSSRKF
ncbi:MAG: TPM domain-containing protein [Alphaproteobacteria bacterium]|nr:TPM domain-containing protein [Alphaproteobacteria bacterium]